MAGGCAVVWGAALLAAAGTAAGQWAESAGLALKTAQPEAVILESGGRVRAVAGVSLAEGATPAAAAAAWMERAVDLFDAGGTEVRARFVVSLDERRTAFLYEQFVDGVPVEGSMARVLVRREGGTARVVYASARLARAHAGGTAGPALGASAAERIAAEEFADEGLTRWAPARAVAVFDDGPDGDAVARRAFACAGWGLGAPRVVYVGAADGRVLGSVEGCLHGTDVVGSVAALATPGVGPDLASGPCPNAPVPVKMAHTLVEGWSGGELVAQAYTDSAGVFRMAAPDRGPLVLRAVLRGPAWSIHTLDGATPGLAPACPTRGEPLSAVAGATPGLPVEFLINAAPAEFGTAQVNVARNLERTWRHVKERVSSDGPIPGLDEVIDAEVNANGAPACNAKYQRDGFGCNGGRPVLMFTIAQPGAPQPCLNSGYSTWVSHEYGHFLLERMLGVTNSLTNPPRTAFHEGFADALAFLVLDTDAFGLGSAGCGTAVRRPLESNRAYPVCLPGGHVRGELLGAVWLRIRAAVPLEEARTMHAAWMFLAAPPAQVPPECATTPRMDQSADEGTLLEVLAADDDDGFLHNGTPHSGAICDAFAAHAIETAVCETERLRRCPCQFDGSTGPSVCDAFDFLVFQNRFGAGLPTACNLDVASGVGVCDVLDFLAFQNAFAAGCR